MNKLYFLLFIFICISCTSKISEGKKIFVTIEPQRYFAEQLADTLFSIEAMVTHGTNPETYDPVPAQFARLSDADAYFCIGRIGFEEVWIDKLKKNYSNLPFFDNSKGIQMIFSENDRHAHSDIPDPHIWTSPKEALIIAENMYEALIEIDPDNSAVYQSNMEILLKEINETDLAVKSLLNSSSQKGFIIYHPTLTYFARDYGLTQYPIEIDGKEPAPEQIKKIVDLAKEKNIKTIFIQREFDRKNAEIISNETGCRLVVIDPLSYYWSREIINIAKVLSDE
ncbi:MAG: zinc ABC transporter substrate-binding protein [Dysgonamonadaceae bacterium]|jgi:zinc transport system substrate-binding protein|nr:zinc ABC transporter substrate-binding protein [Dysgonamonadaceae bacterium]